MMWSLFVALGIALGALACVLVWWMLPWQVVAVVVDEVTDGEGMPKIGAIRLRALWPRKETVTLVTADGGRYWHEINGAANPALREQCCGVWAERVLDPRLAAWRTETRSRLVEASRSLVRRLDEAEAAQGPTTTSEGAP